MYLPVSWWNVKTEPFTFHLTSCAVSVNVWMDSIFIYTHMGYRASLGGSAGKESACNAGDLGSIPGLGRSPGEGKGYPLQFGLENSMDCIVHGVAKSWTQLSDFHFHMGNMYICVIYFILLVFSPGERKGHPLQYSCLENPVDRGAWWAAVHQVTQSRTWLKQLSSSSTVGKNLKRYISTYNWITLLCTWN